MRIFLQNYLGRVEWKRGLMDLVFFLLGESKEIFVIWNSSIDFSIVSLSE
jgi:hypothetical protein